MMHNEFTLWLMPKEPLRGQMRSIIRDLAVEFDAVEFEPHVTVYCGRSSQPEAASVGRAISRAFAPLELKVADIDHSRTFTKTLFVQFRESGVLRRMFEMAGSRFKLKGDYELKPHLSLLYKTLDDVEREVAAAGISVPTDYVFDTLRVVETQVPIEDEAPVRAWRTVYEAALEGAPYF
jgi:hypothetical protein